jgi:hypothetical protein
MYAAVLAIRMMAERGLNTLILIHRRQLLDQWIERLTAFSSLPRDAIGMIGGGRSRPKGQVVPVAFSANDGADKHGRFSAEAIVRRREISALIRKARVLLSDDP